MAGEEAMQSWRNLSVKAKLIGTFGLLIALIIGIALYSIQMMKDDSTQFQNYVHGIQARADMANKVRLAVDERAIAARNLALVTSPQDLAQEKAAVEKAVGDVRKYLAELQALAAKPGVDPEVRAKVDNITRIESEYEPVAMSIVGMVLGNQREAAVEKMNAQCRPLLAALIRATDEYSAFRLANTTHFRRPAEQLCSASSWPDVP